MKKSRSLGDLVSTGLSRAFKSQASLGEEDMEEAKHYPTDASQYELIEECGRGVR